MLLRVEIGGMLDKHVAHDPNAPAHSQQGGRRALGVRSRSKAPVDLAQEADGHASVAPRERLERREIHNAANQVLGRDELA